MRSRCAPGDLASLESPTFPVRSGYLGIGTAATGRRRSADDTERTSAPVRLRRASHRLLTGAGGWGRSARDFTGPWRRERPAGRWDRRHRMRGRCGSSTATRTTSAALAIGAGIKPTSSASWVYRYGGGATTCGSGSLFECRRHRAVSGRDAQFQRREGETRRASRPPRSVSGRTRDFDGKSRRESWPARPPLRSPLAVASRPQPSRPSSGCSMTCGRACGVVATSCSPRSVRLRTWILMRRTWPDSGNWLATAQGQWPSTPRLRQPRRQDWPRRSRRYARPRSRAHSPSFEGCSPSCRRASAGL